MKKSKLNALLFTSLCLIIMSTGCGQQQTNDNKSKTESETSATNSSEDVSRNSNEGIDVAVEEEKPPYDFLVKWSDFSYQGSFINLKNSIKSPIHVESSDLMNKSGYTFLEVPSLYCAIDGITPDVILPYPTEKEWYSVGCISDGETYQPDKISDFLPLAIYTQYPDENFRFFIDSSYDINNQIHLTFFLPGYYPALYDMELVEVDNDNVVTNNIVSQTYPISDDTIAYMGGSASCVFHLTDITSYKEGETITLELKLSEKTDFTDK